MNSKWNPFNAVASGEYMILTAAKKRCFGNAGFRGNQ